MITIISKYDNCVIKSIPNRINLKPYKRKESYTCFIFSKKMMEEQGWKGNSGIMKHPQWCPLYFSDHPLLKHVLELVTDQIK